MAADHTAHPTADRRIRGGGQLAEQALDVAAQDQPALGVGQTRDLRDGADRLGIARLERIVAAHDDVLDTGERDQCGDRVRVVQHSVKYRRRSDASGGSDNAVAVRSGRAT